MEGGRGSVKRSVEDVFIDFKRRRAALIKALTTDVENFYNQCDPDKDNLCLYGFPSGQWEMNLPPEDVPPEIPEPTLGINFARDGMVERDWLSLVAVHSDAWLASLSSYYAARFGFDSNHRKRLFNLMYELPTIFEVVTGTAKKQVEERSAVINNSSRKSKSAGKSLKFDCHSKMAKSLQEEEEEEEEEEDEDKDEDEDEDEDGDGETHCGSCGGAYTTESSDFWIGCDLCENWFHGKCVKITPARAKHIKHYSCRSCSNKRPRI